jgi:hypothetical protein
MFWLLTLPACWSDVTPFIGPGASLKGYRRFQAAATLWARPGGSDQDASETQLVRFRVCQQHGVEPIKSRFKRFG